MVKGNNLQETEKTMTGQVNFVQQMQEQIDQWKALMADYKKGMDSAEAQAKTDYKEMMTQMEESIEQASAMMKQAQEANEKAWNDMEAATMKALEQLQKGYEKAAARYNKP